MFLCHLILLVHLAALVHLADGQGQVVAAGVLPAGLAALFPGAKDDPHARLVRVRVDRPPAEPGFESLLL